MSDFEPLDALISVAGGVLSIAVVLAGASVGWAYLVTMLAIVTAVGRHTRRWMRELDRPDQKTQT